MKHLVLTGGGSAGHAVPNAALIPALSERIPAEAARTSSPFRIPAAVRTGITGIKMSLIICIARWKKPRLCLSSAVIRMSFIPAAAPPLSPGYQIPGWPPFLYSADSSRSIHVPSMHSRFHAALYHSFASFDFLLFFVRLDISTLNTKTRSSAAPQIKSR